MWDWPWFELFILLFLYRYVRLFINLYAFCCLKPVPPPENPTLGPTDVTIIIPCLAAEGLAELERTIESVLQAEPYEIILSTIEANLKRVNDLILDMPAFKLGKVRVVSASHPNKRRQMARAIPEVRTRITLFADDDVTWPESILPWMLAPFKHENTGGVVTCQRVRRPDTFDSFSQRLFYFLGAIYLERRNFDCGATNYMDGGMPCLSGRTVAYRTEILQDEAFTNGFTNEMWWGNKSVKADDDNYISRWMVSHRWKTFIQYHKECEVQTTLEDNWKFIAQCLRWSRSNWRSNLKSLFVEGDIWQRHPYSTYAVFITTLHPPAPVMEGLIPLCLHQALRQGQLSDYGITYWQAMRAFVAFWFTSKWIRNLGHYIRYPVDICLIPVSIIFGWLHGTIIKLWALGTLDQTSWGSREGADTEAARRERGATALSVLDSYQEKQLQMLHSYTH